ncbi:UvrB/UvrC motif-containing protein [Oceaniferula spumae]|uniref:UvrB/UvrC motif-containing protein n=1 Tax=Oceaniferula spumae TaxID=2979115 RepID=UPI003F4E4571
MPSNAFPFAFALGRSTMLAAMQCDYCDSKATVFFTQIIDGNSKKSCLCEKCAMKNGVTDPEGFLLGNMDPSKLSAKASSAVEGVNFKPDATAGGASVPRELGTGICPGCGFAFEDLKKTGRLGCSQCYQFFREEIKHNLGGMHKDTSHVGRVPEGMLEAFEHRQKLDQLEQDMEAAIGAEDYEKAAALRDEIQKLSEKKSEASES